MNNLSRTKASSDIQWPLRTHYVICALIILHIFLITACHESLPPSFETKYVRGALPNSKGKRYCVISFSGETVGLKSGLGGLNEVTGLAVLGELLPLHLGRMTEEWGHMSEIDKSYYLRVDEEMNNLTTTQEKDALREAWDKGERQRVTEMLKAAAKRANENILLRQQSSIREAVEKGDLQHVQETIRSIIIEHNADFGLVVRDRLTWERDGRIYCFRSCTIIFDRQGSEVWSFCGNGGIVAPFEVGTFLNQAAFSPPSKEAIVRYYEPFLDYYPKFVLKLLEEDIAGRQHSGTMKAYFKDVDMIIRNAGASFVGCPSLNDK